MCRAYVVARLEHLAFVGLRNGDAPSYPGEGCSAIRKPIKRTQARSIICRLVVATECPQLLGQQCEVLPRRCVKLCHRRSCSRTTILLPPEPMCSDTFGIRSKGAAVARQVGTRKASTSPERSWTEASMLCQRGKQHHALSTRRTRNVGWYPMSVLAFLTWLERCVDSSVHIGHLSQIYIYHACWLGGKACSSEKMRIR